LGYIAIAILVLIAGYLDWLSLTEAYGSGPPYYGRTVNMDKWSNPLVSLAVVNSVAVIGILVASRKLIAPNRTGSRATAR